MKYIAIEGNIGAGKTTLARLLASELKALLLPEEFADNSFLPKFYAEPERYAFPLELSFLADRYRQMKNLTNEDLFADTLVSDYSFIRSKLFSRVNLAEEEYRLFCRLYDIMDADLTKPDVLIFLHASPEVLMNRIAKRGRSFEKSIREEYLVSLASVYEQHLRECALPVFYIDSTAVDFAKTKTAFEALLAVLSKPSRPAIHYLTFS